VSTFNPNALRRIRTDAGFSRLALAHFAGCSFDSVVRAELGRQTPRCDLVVAFAEALGCDVNDLYTFAVVESPAPRPTKTAKPGRAKRGSSSQKSSTAATKRASTRSRRKAG
jgi:transcriptional regulator with XRE-family HTH domain